MIGHGNGQSKWNALMKDFKTVNKFFLSTEIRLRSFNESSIQCGEIKYRVTSGKYRESIVTEGRDTENSKVVEQ